MTRFRPDWAYRPDLTQRYLVGRSNGRSAVHALRSHWKDKQKAVLEFVKFLKYKQQIEPTSKSSFKGLWADLNFSVSEDDIAVARQEMWSNFGEDIKI